MRRKARRAHPRSRGENRVIAAFSCCLRGSSPLTRGKLAERLLRRAQGRLIPAHAGKTTDEELAAGESGAHPRSRGENLPVPLRNVSLGGSSPLTRGKRAAPRLGMTGVGLIPAHAGKTTKGRIVRFMSRAHPRSRGENMLAYDPQISRPGSSPLTRGKQILDRQKRVDARLIPAHAGKTVAADSLTDPYGAHPRSRGENDGRLRSRRVAYGSSPLTRGKRSVLSSPIGRNRLIPAHAGKTQVVLVPGFKIPAHPRSRGENSALAISPGTNVGSSPLTRGKRGCELSHICILRLIPAHAGKTLPDLRFYCADRSDLGNP